MILPFLKAVRFLSLVLLLVISTLPCASQPPIQWQKALGGGNDDDTRDFIHTSDGGYVAAGTAISPDGDVSGHHGFVDYWVVKLNASGALQWQKALGGSQSDVALSVQQTRDGGYVVAGYAMSSDGQVTGHHGYADAWIVKLDVNGALQWQKALGGSSFDNAYCVRQTPDGGYLVAGNTSSSDGDVTGSRGGTDAWVVKLDAGGALQWQKTYGGSGIDDLSSIDAVASGGYILSGYTTSNDGQVSGNHGAEDLWVVRIDDQGNLLWQKTLGGSAMDAGEYVLTTPDGGYIVAGNTRSADGDVTGQHGEVDYWVVKLDAGGSVQWQKCYGGSAEDMVTSIQPTPGGGYVLGGRASSTNGDVSGNKGGGDLWVVKITASGAIEWQKCYGGNRMEYVGGVVPTADGWYAAGCATNSTSGDVTGLHGLSFDVWVVKLGPDPRCAPALTATVTKDTICMGTPVTFTATVTNGGTNAVYRWKKNNVVVGSNSATYTPVGIREGDVVVCEYSCRTSCDRDTTLVSAPIAMTVLDDMEPVVTVAASATTVCEGTPVTFTATPFYGHMVPSYQWLVNGTAAGTNSTTFTAPSLSNGAVVLCIMTVSHPSCQGSTKDYSDPIAITVNPITAPSVAIAASATKICKGTSVTFTAKGNGGARPTYQWKVNDVAVGTGGNTFTTATLSQGDVVSCVMTADPSTACLTGTTATASPLVMEVKEVPLPTVSITATQNDVCAGTPITFTARAQDAGNTPLYQWQVNGTAAGGNSPTFTTSQLASGDKVTCLLSSNGSECPNAVSLSNTEVVRIREVPSILFSPASLTVMSGQQVQLNASVSGTVASFTWTPAGALTNPQTLTPTTVPLSSTTAYTLSVTGVNGCTAEKELTVQVTHQLYMPNSFTPNGDGLNDEFRIPPGVGLQLEEFSVFDRWGNRVFTTREVGKSWTGKRDGVLHPAGAYVFLVRGKDSRGPVFLKGVVTLIR